MSAAWDTAKSVPENEKRQKRVIRMWGYLSIAGLFLIYVAYASGVNPF
jgi:hypothetical protein